MSAIASAARYPTIKFSGEGSTIGGKIVEFRDVQVRDFKTKELVFWDKENTQPKMQVLAVVEQANGERGVIYIKGDMFTKAKEAIQASGALDLEAGAHISFTWTHSEPAQGGGNDRHVHTCEYTRPIFAHDDDLPF